MNAKTYLFLPEKKIIKQGFYLEDENKLVVYEARMLKQGIISKSEYKFINNIKNTSEIHKIGHTVTIEEIDSNNIYDISKTKSYFKIDGINIWDYFKNNNYIIETDNKDGIRYILKKNNETIAIIEMSNLNGSSIIMNRFVYQIKAAEENIDIAFLLAFSLSKTNHVFYD